VLVSVAAVVGLCDAYHCCPRVFYRRPHGRTHARARRCFALAPDASLPADTPKSTYITGGAAEVLTSSLLSNFALCQGAGAAEGMFWT
jgi:hypothetical protein